MRDANNRLAGDQPPSSGPVLTLVQRWPYGQTKQLEQIDDARLVSPPIQNTCVLARLHRSFFLETRTVETLEAPTRTFAILVPLVSSVGTEPVEAALSLIRGHARGAA
jgi:hypothetical protein